MSLYAGKSDGTVAIVAGASGLEAESAMKQKGFVLASQPLNPLEGDLWINSNTLPTTFPVSGVKKYQNGSWINFGSYSPARFDLWTLYTSENGYTNYYWDSNASKWVSLSGGTSDSYTKTEIDAKLNAKANTTDTYNKTETDTKLNTKANTTDISKIKEEQTTQNENISTNADEITNLKNENSYLQKVVKQAFTETSASGTELTINNTIEARMEMKLNGNTSQNTTTGKNLLNGKYKNTSTQNGITLKHNNDNSFDITGTATSTTPFTIISSIDQSNLVVGNTYYFYMSEKYDSTNLNVSLSTETPKLSYWIANKAYTIEENQKFNNIYLYIPSGVTMNYHNVKFMIVQGSTATSYEPYTGGIASPNPDYPQEIHCVKGNNVVKVTNQNLFDESEEYPINLGSLELCKIGDYQDYIYKKDNKWYKHKVISKRICYPTDVASKLEGKTKAYQFGSLNDALMSGKFYREKGFCDISYNNIIGSMYGDKDAYGWNIEKDDSFNNNNFNIRFDKEKFPNLDTIKNYFKDKGVTFYYILATPTEEEITDTALITQLNEISQALSKKGTTIISQRNDDLPFNLDVNVYTKTEIDTKLGTKQDKLTAGNNITIINNTISAKDTTYSIATNSVDGLMSKTDKAKLDGLSNYFVRMPYTLAKWAVGVDSETAPQYTPTDSELKTYMTTATSECGGKTPKQFISECLDNGYIMYYPSVQSLADRSSYYSHYFTIATVADYDHDYNRMWRYQFTGLNNNGFDFYIAWNLNEQYRWNEPFGEGGGGLACFTSDTLVLTEDGYKQIVNVKEGDKVYSLNENTNKIELKEIDKLVNHNVDDIYYIVLENELIKSSWSHPFYVEGKGKVLAKELKAGDNLKTKDGTLREIKAINIIRNKLTTVYEIRVKDNHNYYVGRDSILVYNEESIL